ncbi:hypothetical protein HH310_15855 [Actinoplanes sp. TBRC 11911]|uniref:hypothetical protein n=1 Tax=Actinoplanes sp. TBRC 11911 TaxID=2729386 RepID=UPI00145FA63B|nr:hypothetical protein [Actinoplanes sp. TBRC 11911]NMO52662.1 hypothetical protein [Actinoplanes sp. TBRC 11911]
MRGRIKLGISFGLVVAGIAAISWNLAPASVAAVDPGDKGDSGDAQVISTYDGPMVRKRAAIGILPSKNADLDHIRAEVLALAKREKVGPLTESTFAVFNEHLLTYLVPQLTFIAPEGVSVTRAEAMLRDYQPADVAFHVTDTVLVHDLTFAVIPAAGVQPAAVSKELDEEGILTDSLNFYDTKVQQAGLTVHYFGAVVSDSTVSTVRKEMGRAANVPAERVLVEGTLPGPGVDLSDGVPALGNGGHSGH